MKKILCLLLGCVAASVFAQVGDGLKQNSGCSIWLFSTDTKPKDFMFSYYDNQNDTVLDYKYTFARYKNDGFDFARTYNCSTEKYNNHLTYAFSNSTCKEPIDSSTIANLGRGEARRYECNDNTSIHAYKLSDNSFEMYLEPKGYTAFLIDGGDTSGRGDNMLLSVVGEAKVINSPDFVKHCPLTEGFYRCDGKIPINTRVLVKNGADAGGAVSFWLANADGDYKKIGVCGFKALDDGRVSASCSKEVSDATDYKFTKETANWITVYN